MISYYLKRIKYKLLRMCKNIAKKLCFLGLLLIIGYYFFIEIELWVKSQSEKLIKDSFTSEINKIHSSPKFIKEKINSEIIEKDLTILKEELSRLGHDFKEKEIKRALLRVRILEDKINNFKEDTMIDKDWLEKIQRNIDNIKMKMENNSKNKDEK